MSTGSRTFYGSHNRRKKKLLNRVRRLEQGVSLGEAERAPEVSANVLHRWRAELRSGAGNVFPDNGKQRWSEGRIAELERKIGRQASEMDFVKGCLQGIEETRMLQALTENPPSIKGPEEEVKAAAMRTNGRLTIERMVELGRVSRSGFYRFDSAAAPRADPHMDQRDAIERIAVGS